MNLRRQLILLGTLCAIAGVTPLAAHAASISYSASHPLTPTSWSSSLAFPLFDPSLGTLTSVSFALDGHCEGTARFESLDSAPAIVTMNLAASVTLHRPDLSTLVTVLPLAATVDTVGSFDGVIDFDGTSGRTHAGLSADASDGATSSSPADLALFTGAGSIALPIAAAGASTGSGAGNLILQFNTSGSAAATVTYEYDPVGACCDETGVCAVLTEADCQASGGAWAGAETTCDPNPCPQPTGACCLATGACVVLTEAECGTAGGAWQGSGTSCDPSPCALPTGACCYPDGTCAILNGIACGATGGVYQGDGSDCDPNPCPPPVPTGACCFHATGDCQILTVDACTTAGGTYMGDGVACTPDLCRTSATEKTSWGAVKTLVR